MSGLIGWWPLHENSGSTARDLSGNGNHGSLNGGVTQGVAGKSGLMAYSFDGTDDYISMGSISVGEKVTASCWINLDSRKQSENHTIGPHVDNGDSRGFRIFTDSDTGEIGVWTRNDGSDVDNLYTSYTPPLDNWVFIAFVYDGSTGHLYADGDKIGSKSMTANPFAGNAFISRYSGGGYNLDGQETDVRLYNRALTPQEIQSLYEAGSRDYARPLNDQNSSSAVSRWAFDGDATDSWGDQDGVLYGDASVGNSDAIRGGSLALDGSGDYVDISDVNIGTKHSISIWAKQETTQSEGRIILGRNGGRGYFPWTDNNGSNFWYRAQNETVTFDSKPPSYFIGNYIHLCAVRNESDVSLYINGVRKDTKTLASNVDFIFNQIGADTDNSNSYFWDGSIDDVRIYDKALSPHEVFELYQWGTRGRDMRKQLVNKR